MCESESQMVIQILKVWLLQDDVTISKQVPSIWRPSSGVSLWGRDVSGIPKHSDELGETSSGVRCTGRTLVYTRACVAGGSV